MKRKSVSRQLAEALRTIARNPDAIYRQQDVEFHRVLFQTLCDALQCLTEASHHLPTLVPDHDMDEYTLAIDNLGDTWDKLELLIGRLQQWHVERLNTVLPSTPGKLPKDQIPTLR